MTVPQHLHSYYTKITLLLGLCSLAHITSAQETSSKTLQTITHDSPTIQLATIPSNQSLLSLCDEILFHIFVDTALAKRTLLNAVTDFKQFFSEKQRLSAAAGIQCCRKFNSSFIADVYKKFIKECAAKFLDHNPLSKIQITAALGNQHAIRGLQKLWINDEHLASEIGDLLRIRLIAGTYATFLMHLCDEFYKSTAGQRWNGGIRITRRHGYPTITT